MKIAVVIEGGAAHRTRVEREFDVDNGEDVVSMDGANVVRMDTVRLQQAATAAAKAAVELHTLTSL